MLYLLIKTDGEKMLKRFRDFTLAPYYRHTFVEQKKAEALFYYILISIPLIFIILILVFFFSPDNLITVVPMVVLVYTVAIVTLALLRKGKYPIAANIITSIILLALLGGLAVRSHLNPLSVFSSNFYLLLVVIVQASIFCTRNMVIACSILMVIANIIFYIMVPDNVNTVHQSDITISFIYITLAILMTSLLTLFSSGIFKSAMTKLENELTVNVAQFFQIQDLHDSSEKLQQDYAVAKEVSLKDALTGLKNRRFLNEVISDEIKIFLQQKSSISQTGGDKRSRTLGVYGIFIADIDYFKRVNDEYGHDSGDMVLQQFSEILISSIRKDDIAIRYGGEEFLIILKNSVPGYLPIFAEKLRAAVADHDFRIRGGSEIQKTCSTGFCALPFDDLNPGNLILQDCISLADSALYYSKKHGRNRWTGIQKGLSELQGTDIKAVCDSLEESGRSNRIQIITGTAGNSGNPEN